MATGPKRSARKSNVEGSAPEETSGIRNSLFLASAVRSGSTYVAEEIAYRLQRDGGFQFFNLTRDSFSGLTNDSTARDIQNIYRKLFVDTSGWASSKIHSAALSVITRESRRDPTLYKAFFGPRARWIVVQRRDKIAQAVSLAMARKTRTWHSYSRSKSAEKSAQEVSLMEIEAALRSILLDDVYLEAFSRNLSPKQMIRVNYEDVVSSGRQAAAAVIALCGLDVKLKRDKKKQVAKIVRTGRQMKGRLAEEFAAWLGENYHETSVSRVAETTDAATDDSGTARASHSVRSSTGISGTPADVSGSAVKCSN